jgi:uncharacterized membrane protein YoaK (UPF0700 family)
MDDVRTRPEPLPVGMLLAGVGGFLDAYTYVGYHGVFANAQTGNVVLLGVDAQAGHWQDALLHVPPVVAFVLGVALAHGLARPKVREIVRHPTRWVLITEIVVLAIVGALPGGIPRGIVPGAISFVSAAQVATFRSLEGIGYTSTITTGNLRDLTAAFLKWRAGRDLVARRRTAVLASIIAGFAVGAGIGGLCTRLIQHRAAWVAAAVLAGVLVTIVAETRRLERPGESPPEESPPDP